MIWTLIVGVVAGLAAKAISPQQESGGWISTIAIGMLGSWLGNFILNSLGITFMSDTIIGDLIIGVGGAVLLLFLYYKFLADKLNLPI